VYDGPVCSFAHSFVQTARDWVKSAPVNSALSMRVPGILGKLFLHSFQSEISPFVPAFQEVGPQPPGSSLVFSRKFLPWLPSFSLGRSFLTGGVFSFQPPHMFSTLCISCPHPYTLTSGECFSGNEPFLYSYTVVVFSARSREFQEVTSVCRFAAK